MKILKASIFVIIFVVSLELMLRLAGLAYLYIKENASSGRNPDGSTVILCIGESTTAFGLGESYPSQLQQRLDQIYGKGKFAVVNAGVPGSDTEKIKAALNENIEKYNPDIVITMMGINDTWQLRGKFQAWYTSFQTYKLYKIAKTNAIDYLEFLIRRWTLPKVTTPQSMEGDKFYFKKDFAKAVEGYKNSLSKDPSPSELHYKIGLALLEDGKRLEAVPYFETYLQTDYTLRYMINIINMYFYNFGQFVQENRVIARNLAEKILEKYPDNPEVLRVAGLGYQDDDVKKAEGYLERAVAGGDKMEGSYSPLAVLYRKQNKIEKAIDILKIGKTSESDMGFFMARDLIEILMDQKRYPEAKVEIEEAIQKYPDNQTLLDVKHKLEFLMGDKVEETELKDVTYWALNFLKFPPTRRNYVEVATLLRAKKLKHVAMQYPVRSIDDLKELLKDFPDVVFIENRNNFLNTLKTKKYEELFSDKFGIDFGHFTLVGSVLVVDNLIEGLKPVLDHYSAVGN